MRLKEVMTRQVHQISPDATLQEAAQKMLSFDVGALPVCQGDELIGIVTDRDIAVRAVADGRNPAQTRVLDVMSPQAKFCYDDDKIEQAIQLMEHERIRRIPVFDHSQRLCGIVSLGDLATRLHDQIISAEVLEYVSTGGLHA